ncbi:hypothetical protein AFEL58S_00472 [Afipia felis]|jgi:hypothetical protein
MAALAISSLLSQRKWVHEKQVKLAIFQQTKDARVTYPITLRIWRREGLKVPVKQPKRGRLWLNDGSCIRLRPERPNHVWSYDS